MWTSAKSIRLRSGLSVSAFAEKVKLRPATVMALETGKYHDLDVGPPMEWLLARNSERLEGRNTYQASQENL
jgi:hypothetical protein